MREWHNAFKTNSLHQTLKRTKENRKFKMESQLRMMQTNVTEFRIHMDATALCHQITFMLHKNRKYA